MPNVTPHNGNAQDATELVWALALTLNENALLYDGFFLTHMGDGLASLSVTNSNKGAHGLGNPGAWLLFGDTITGEQLLIVRGPDPGVSWKVSYSTTGAFDVFSIGPRRPPAAPDEVIAVDFGTRLFEPGPKTYVVVTGIVGVAPNFVLVANDTHLHTVRSVISYNFAHPRRFVWHMGPFGGPEPTRFRKTYPRRRQEPRVVP